MLSSVAKRILARQLPYVQKSAGWLAARHMTLSSSDAAASLDSNRFRSSLDLLRDKCKPIDKLTPITNHSIEWGEKFEPKAIEVYEKITNEKVNSCNLVIHEQYNWLAASPDGVLNSGKLLEIKCPYYRKIRYDRIPEHYWIQIQMQMECCDVEEVDLMQCEFDNVMSPPDTTIYKHSGEMPDGTYWVLKKYTLETIQRNREWFERSLPIMADFWRKVIYYRRMGYNKLMADVTQKQVYYNLTTNSFEYDDEDKQSPDNPFTMMLNTSTTTNNKDKNKDNDKDTPDKDDIAMLTVDIPQIKPRNNNIADEKTEIDMDDLALPPPVISSTSTNNTTSSINNDNTRITRSMSRKKRSHDTMVENSKNTYDISSDSDSGSVSPYSGNESDVECMSPVLSPLPFTLPRDWSKWVSASSTRNYAIKDPLCDWLNEYGKNKRQRTESAQSLSTNLKLNDYQEDKKDTSPFVTYLQGKGIEFEEAVVAHLYQRFPNDIVTSANPYQVRLQTKYDECIEEMKKATPIIYQGVLHNKANKTYGVADLIVRSDWVNKIFETPVISDADAKIGCKFHKNMHYRVIDIKYSTLSLRSDGTHILNYGSTPAYKTQLYIYNQAVGNAQGYLPPCAYVLGRKWKYTKCGNRYSGDGWFDRAGVIDYTSTDNIYNDISEKAIDWIKEVRTDGADWSIDPPSRQELYPNMKNHSDNPWHGTKVKIANKIGEITNIWMCGIEQRDTALRKGIKSWRDKRLTADAMGIKGKKTAPIVDAILKINRGRKPYTPRYIDNDLRRYKVEFFVDFETINEAVEPIDNGSPTTHNLTYLFMIGVGWRVNDGKRAHWNYECFTTSHVDFEGDEELQNFIDFHEFLNEIIEEYNAHDDFMLYHWSSAEITIYNTIFERYIKYLDEYVNLLEDKWYDLFKVFKNNPIVIKGAFNFSLKSIATALHKHGYIKTKWETGGIANGLNAMVKTMECSEEAKLRNIEMDEMPIMKEITHYNEIDCRVLLEILSFLRHNMIKKKSKPKKKRLRRPTISK